MLTINYRVTQAVPLYETLESYIVKYHGPNEFKSVQSAVKALHECRTEISQLTCYDDPILLQKYNKILIDYYVGMSFLSTKFKFGDDSESIDITWVWQDSLTGEKKFTNKDLSLELNSVLYNLGAVINNMGTHTPIEGENIKTISQKFQESAWIFDHLKESSKSLSPSTRSHDFSVENLLFLSTLQLAQSQYCFFKKADNAKMSAAMMAKITNQLKTFFEDTERYARSSPVLKKGTYLPTIAFYKSYYQALAFYHKGMEAKDDVKNKGEGMGIAGGLLKKSLALIETAGKLAESSTRDACAAKKAAFTAEYEEICLQNKNVYFEKDASDKELESIAFESKNFTLYRSIEAQLT